MRDWRKALAFYRKAQSVEERADNRKWGVFADPLGDEHGMMDFRLSRIKKTCWGLPTINWPRHSMNNAAFIACSTKRNRASPGLLMADTSANPNQRLGVTVRPNQSLYSDVHPPHGLLLCTSTAILRTIATPNDGIPLEPSVINNAHLLSSCFSLYQYRQDFRFNLQEIDIYNIIITTRQGHGAKDDSFQDKPPPRISAKAVDSASVNNRERVRKRKPSGPSNENMPPRPGTISMVS